MVVAGWNDWFAIARNWCCSWLFDTRGDQTQIKQ